MSKREPVPGDWMENSSVPEPTKLPEAPKWEPDQDKPAILVALVGEYGRILPSNE